MILFRKTRECVFHCGLMALTYYPFLLANSNHQKEFHIIKKSYMKFEENQLTMSNKHEVMNIRQNVGPNENYGQTFPQSFHYRPRQHHPSTKFIPTVT